IIILIAVGVFALFLFSRLANTVGKTITENYQSDAAAVEMMLAVGRMDAALDPRKDDKPTAKLMFDTNARIFEEKLSSLSTNAAVTTQANTITTELRTNFQALRAVGRGMLDPVASRPDQRALYDIHVV